MNSDIIAAQSAALEPEQFQAVLIANLSRTLTRENPPPCLLRAPTGSGKTFVISKGLERVNDASPTLWFWFVPFVNLVQQTEDAIAGNTQRLVPVSLIRGRNQDPSGGIVIISTAQGVARGKSRRENYTDGEDDTTRSLDGQVALARAKGLKIGLVVDEAHIGLDNQTEFGQFAHWLKPDRLIMATATPKDERLIEFIQKAGYSGIETFAVSRDDVVAARLNKRFIEAVVYDLRMSMQTVTDLQQTVLKQGWRRSQRLKEKLRKLGIPITPLLLVQVANGPNTVADARQQLMDLCKVEPAAIGEHSSDEPDPVLMASIANDSTKEVLIFKQSAGTGFDAPRAFVLASTKPVNDPDFAAQFIGRVMRVHLSIRAAFPRPLVVDPELDTAYVYLANAQAQQGFEQAVAATASLRSQLEGQTEKLESRRMASGAVVYTNRVADTVPLFFDAPLPTVGAKPRAATPLIATIGSTPDLLEHAGGGPAFAESTEELDEIAEVPSASVPKSALKKLETKEDFLKALPAVGMRAYPLRKISGLPAALQTEKRPEMGDMANASRMAATRLEITHAVQTMAVSMALGKSTEKEVHTELTTSARTEVNVYVVVDRKILAKEAMKRLLDLPQVEEEDASIIIDVLSKRLRPAIEAALENPDADPPDEADIKRFARDAAFALVRREYEGLAEKLHEEISAQAESIQAMPLPDAMIFAHEISLEPSSKNIYGVMPPSKDDLGKISQLLTINAREQLVEHVMEFEHGPLSLAPYDGAHALGHEERIFAKALDRTSFVQWWHRNPDRKGFSVRLVRGEHKNYFYPDFLVCLEHFPGDTPLQRLLETKESVKDAARKARHASRFYGPVLFITKDQSKWRSVNEDGSLGVIIDMDDLTAMQEWLRATVPRATQ